MPHWDAPFKPSETKLKGAKVGLVITSGSCFMLNRRLLRIGKPFFPRIALVAAFAVGSIATYFGQAVLLASALSSAVASRPWALLIGPATGVLLLMLLRWLIVWKRGELALRAGSRIRESTRSELYSKLAQLGPPYLDTAKTGDVVAILDEGVGYLEPYFSQFVPLLIASAVCVTSVTVFIATVDLVVGVVLAGAVLLVFAAPILFRQLQAKSSLRWFEAHRDLYAESIDGIQGMPTLLAFNADRRWVERMDERAREFEVASVGMTISHGLGGALAGVGIVLGTGLVVGVAALRASDGLIAVEEAFLILLLSRECFRPIAELRRALHFANPLLAVAQGIFQLEDAEPLATPLTPRSDLPSSTSIRFRDVCFRYREDRGLALDRVSVAIEEGETIGVVGRSGSGKTTLVSLLLRMRDPESGSVAIGDVNVRDFDPMELRALVSLVSQDTFLFSGSVRENVAMGRPGSDEESILRALNQASADFVHALPDGVDSQIGERGVRLSGGQRQRLAIARAFLKDAPILILDEPTSSLDSAHEAEIQASLGLLRANRTTLIVAHRLSTVREVDRIIVLNEGRVVEEGSPSELAISSGHFARLMAAQAHQ